MTSPTYPADEPGPAVPESPGGHPEPDPEPELEPDPELEPELAPKGAETLPPRKDGYQPL